MDRDTTPVTTSDADLVAAWRGGHARAGEHLFARHVGPISRFFRNKVPEPEVPDLVAQTFLGVLAGKDRIRQETGFRRFVYGVAQNVLYDYIRKRYKRAREHVDFATVCIATLDPRSQSSIVMRQRELQAFVVALRELPLTDQIVLELRYFENMTGPAIADALALPEGTVRGRLARAVARLQIRVGEHLASRGPTEQPTPDTLETWAQRIRDRLGWLPS